MASRTSPKKDGKYKNRHIVNFLRNPAAWFREKPTAPLRVLVSTATHLVPGYGYYQRTTFIANVVCQQHWGNDFQRGRDRLRTHNADFAFDNRACYFLIDHGKSPDGGDDSVPILRYRWTGTELTLVREPLPDIVRKKIKEVPFTPAPARTRRGFTALEQRQRILKCLHREMGLKASHFEFLRENPEHARWLERKLEPRLWSKFKSLEEANSRETAERFASMRWLKLKVPKDSTPR